MLLISIGSINIKEVRTEFECWRDSNNNGLEEVGAEPELENDSQNELKPDGEEEPEPENEGQNDDGELFGKNDLLH